ncbi:MAG: sulfur carrier protein ThiS [Verrucomicrobiota bacterium JB025]|nr:sulfur carrier protein ThiS [Verrucomicrobiota bacterium JB025]
MTITLNGKPHETAGPLSLEELLESLGMAGKPVVAELDEKAVFPRDFASTTVEAGAKVEVVALAAGG